MIPGYRIIRELGRGGMATVYLAEQESLGREVALKVLKPSLAADTDFAERFLREARFAGSFRHRNLLPVYDAGRAGEHLFLAMEVVPGGHAGDLRGGDPEEIRRCLIEVASGLAHAHSKGVVHRDIKPENILRREDGSFVISDFGIARSTQATGELTGAQAAIGTPSYMSPEQWRGDSIDGRADIYSLGVVAFELLTGRTPFHGDDGWAIGMQHMTAARPRLPDALADWQPILERMLAVDRNLRYAQANELIAALGGKPETTPVAGSTPRAQPALHATTPIPAQRSRTRWILPVTSLVLMLLAGLVYWLRRDDVPAATQARARAGNAGPVEAKPPPAAGKSIAVLPFRVLSTEPGDALFADGLSEEILSSFAAIPELKVPGRTSSFVWKDKPTDIREIARTLGVAHILEGSIRRDGDKLRITANLLSASDGATLWSQTFDRSAEDVFAIQNDIAIAVTDRLAVQMGTPTLPTLARLPSAKRGAYLETIGALRTLPFDQISALVQKLRELEASEEVGPDLYVRLLHLIGHLARNEILGYPEALAEQEAYLKKLTARFPGSVEVLQGQALVVNSRGDAGNRLADYEQALRLFNQVLARLPNDALAASQAAFVARTLLRHAEAVDLARRAVEIDPEDPVALFALANALGSAGQGDAAVAAMRELVRRFPASPYVGNLGQFLAGNGQLAESTVEYRRSCLASPDAGDCVYAGRLLHLLGFRRSAVELESREPERLKIYSRGFEALRSGDFPEARYAIFYLTLIEAVSEAAAQRRPDLVAVYRDAGWAGRRGRVLQPDGVSADEFDVRTAVRFVAAALIGESGGDAERVRRDIEAMARMAKAMPPKTMPYPTVHWTLGAEILSGDLDAVFHRLDGFVESNPLYWQYWVISPSGRDVPTAKILRADPRFDAIWARRAALIERERAKLKQLWPEVQ